jgi:hypothetical protein
MSSVIAPVLLLALLAACVPSPQQDYPTQAETIFPATAGSVTNGHEWNSGKCEYVARFSGAPSAKRDVTTPKPFELDTAAEFKDNDSNGVTRYVETAACECSTSSTVVPSDTTKLVAVSDVQEFMRKLEVKNPKTSFMVNSSSEKILEVEGLTGSMLGDVLLRLKYYYTKKCVLQLITVTFASDSAANNKSLAYLNSPRNPRAPTIPAVAIPASQPTDAATRLKALNDLLDQKLITKDEYNAKRKAILDGM